MSLQVAGGQGAGQGFDIRNRGLARFGRRRWDVVGGQTEAACVHQGAENVGVVGEMEISIVVGMICDARRVALVCAFRAK